MSLPPTIDSEDRRTAILREVWTECHAYISRLLWDEPDMVDDILMEAAADFIVRWRDEGEMNRNEAAATIKHSAKCDVIDHRKKQGRRATSLVALDDEILAKHADPNADNEILAALGRIDHDRLIAQLPELLTEKQRLVIVTVDVEGLTQKDAAAQLGISVRGLQNTRGEALRRLRRHLTTPPPEPAPDHSARPRKETPQ